MNVDNYGNYIVKESLTPEQLRQKKQQVLSSQMRMYLSKKLSDILKTMNSPISSELLSLSSKDIKFDISYMDVTDDGMVTFISTIKALKIDANLKSDKMSPEGTEVWISSQRVQPTRINRVVGKIFKKYSPSEIEQFGNEFKAKCNKDDSKMRVVYGEDIRKYYNENIYSKTIYGGTLKGSCMRYEQKQPFFDIYCKNTPNSGSFSHVGLLILLDDDDKLIGRALVWFNSVKPEPGRVFMDRIYYMRDSDQTVFIDYAKERNWLYKQAQTFNNANYIDPSDSKKHGLTLAFRLNPQKYKKYPFLDTLLYYTPETGRISSKQNKNPKYKSYRIQSQDGGAEGI